MCTTMIDKLKARLTFMILPGADDASRSFQAKQFFPSVHPTTIADGLLTSLGTHTFPLILANVDAIHTVTEEEIMYVQ